MHNERGTFRSRCAWASPSTGTRGRSCSTVCSNLLHFTFSFLDEGCNQISSSWYLSLLVHGTFNLQVCKYSEPRLKSDLKKICMGAVFVLWHLVIKANWCNEQWRFWSGNARWTLACWRNRAPLVAELEIDLFDITMIWGLVMVFRQTYGL